MVHFLPFSTFFQGYSPGVSRLKLGGIQKVAAMIYFSDIFQMDIRPLKPL